MTSPNTKESKKRDVFVGPPYHPTYFVIGRKGAGKSVLVERAGELYYRKFNYVVCDWASAFDLECLHWCVPNPKLPEEKQIAYPVLMIVPRTTQIISDKRLIKNHKGEMVEAVKWVFDDTPLAKIIQQCYEESRVCLFSIYFYQDPRKGQMKFSQMIRELPIVMRDSVPSHINVALLLREIADLASNRMKNYGGGSETESKRSLTQFSRMIRHARVTGIYDVQNPDDVYGAFVAQEDYILVKRLNKHHYPAKLTWLVNDIKERLHRASRHYMRDRISYVDLDRLSNNSFCCVFPDGDYDFYHNHEPTFKHHEVADDAKSLAGITMKFIPKSEMVKNVEVKLQEKKDRASERDKKLEVAKEAYKLYKSGGVTYDDLAKRFGWIGKDGKASGQALLVYISRKIDDGLIES